MPDIPQIVLPHGGYRKLIVYRKSETIYQATVLFCRRFLPKFGDRTVDQMTQAARSCKQNIAEGSASSGTSKETEIKLTNVARATLDELLEDYLDYLKAHGAGEWSMRDEKKKAARDYAKEHADWADWQKFFKTRDDETCCNLMIVIIQQTKYLLDQMIRRQEADFKKFGGVRERMHAARTAARGEDWDKGVYSRLDGATSAAELKSRLAEIVRRTRESAATIARRKGWSPLSLLSLFSLPHLLPSLLSSLSLLSLLPLSLLSLLSFAPLVAMADTEVVDVAGTDPTDENDVFKVSVTMVGGKPVVSYTPQLSDPEKAKRKYTTWGKVKLQDEKWVEIPSGSENDYNFFKVTVEMR